MSSRALGYVLHRRSSSDFISSRWVLPLAGHEEATTGRFSSRATWMTCFSGT